MRGLGERGGGFVFFARRPVDDDIVRRRIPDLRTGRRGLKRARRVERLVVDGDQLGRIARLRIGLGDHHGDRFADEGDELSAQLRLRRDAHGRAVAALQRRQTRHGSRAGLLDVVLRQDGNDAGCCFRGRDVHAPDARHGRAGFGETPTCASFVETQVIRILTLSRDEADILRSANGLSNAEFHGVPSSVCNSDRCGRACAGAQARPARRARLRTPVRPAVPSSPARPGSAS